MKINKLSEYLQKLEKTSSRLKITEILAELYKEADKKEVDKMTYLILGRLAPQFESIIFNVAEQMMIDALAQVYAKDKKEIKEIYKQKGDLGNVAFSLSKNKTSKLTVLDVYQSLVDIANEEGEGSVERKVNGMANLLDSLDSLSAKYVTRIPIGKLRLGFSEKTILDALSWTKNKDKSLKKELEQAYFVVPDAGRVARKFLGGGLKSFKNLSPEVGVPVLPMLAQRLKSPKEMIEKMGEVSVEPKLDGLRIQIHYKSGSKGFVKSFTRNLNETSWMFPELHKIAKSIKAKEIILDGEAIGVDEETKKLANFQTTMTRRRKHDIDKISHSVPISFYVFDVLMVNGKNQMHKTYLERRKVLQKHVKDIKPIKIVEYRLTDDPKEITKLHKEYLKKDLEGVIVKNQDGEYVPGRTGWRWVKMKEVEEAEGKLSDTVDCVVMGYTRGKGKRAEFGIGQFLAGIRQKDKFKTITKVGTGLTDEQFREMKKRLTKLQVKEKPKEYEVHKDLEPDFWVAPSLVVELAADEITKSPKHTAGYALRFPRLIRFRDDKSPNQATTVKEIKSIM